MRICVKIDGQENNDIFSEIKDQGIKIIQNIYNNIIKKFKYKALRKMAWKKSKPFLMEQNIVQLVLLKIIERLVQF